MVAGVLSLELFYESLLCRYFIFPKELFFRKDTQYHHELVKGIQKVQKCIKTKTKNTFSPYLFMNVCTQGTHDCNAVFVKQSDVRDEKWHVFSYICFTLV